MSSAQQTTPSPSVPRDESVAHKVYSPVLDELPRDVIQAVPVADTNRLQLPFRSIKDLLHPSRNTQRPDEPQR